MKHAFNNCCIVSKGIGEITVEQKRINNALMKNHNAIIKWITKVANGYRNWERFRNRCMLVLEKASILNLTRMMEALKWLKKRTRTTKSCPSLKSALNRFGGICRSLNSWRANTPNSIQIYCALISSRFARYIVHITPPKHASTLSISV